MKHVHYSYIITDVDGVILDRMHAYGDLFVELLAPLGVDKKHARSYYFGSAGTPIIEQIRTACQQAGVHIDEEHAKDLTRSFFAQAQNVGARMFTGAARTIHTLARSGRRLFASTGSQTHEVESIFERAGIRTCYHMILGSDRIPKSTRHIELFAVSQGVDMDQYCSRAMFVGDGTRDMEIARQCGIVAIGVATTVSEETLRNAGAHHVISHITEFPEMVATYEASH